MKILEALYSDTVGGSEKLGLALANNFRSRGHDCDILTIFRGDGTLVDEVKASNLQLHAANFHGRSPRRLVVPALLYALFKREQYDVIHCHHMTVFFHCLWPSKLAGIKRIIVTEHAHQHIVHNSRLIKRSRRLVRYADKLTVIHSGLADFFQGTIEVPEDNLRLIPNGVDTQNFFPGARNFELVRTLSLPSWNVTIGCVCRLHVDKDVPNLLTAFKAVLEQSSRSVGLIIVGEGSERRTVQNRIIELGLTENVRLVGFDENVAGWMRHFDVFVLPSRREGVPLVVLEALSTGVPVVATKVGGIPDVIDDSVGRLVPPGDSNALSTAILELVDNQDTLNRLAKNARSAALERFSFEKMADAYLEVFEHD